MTTSDQSSARPGQGADTTPVDATAGEPGPAERYAAMRRDAA